MWMLRFTMGLVLSIGIGINIYAEDVSRLSAKEVLARTLEKLKPVHTARYTMTKYRYESMADSFYSDRTIRKYVECENAADTSGLPMFVVISPDGKLERAYNGKNSIYEREGYIERNDLSRHFGVRTIDPPFFNHVTHFCEYLLRPGGNRELTVMETDSTLVVNAVLSEYQRIAFHGNPYVSMSYPYEKSYFCLTVDKSSYMPQRISYLLGQPASWYEKVVSDVELNPIEPESFDICSYFPDLPIYDSGEDQRAQNKKVREENMKRVDSNPLPSDTLSLVGGGVISLDDYKGKVKILLFTSNYCGYCRDAYPFVTKLCDDYSHEDVAVFGVVLESEAEMPTLEALKERYQIRFPLAKNNGHFYEYFMPSGLAPVILIIDRDDKVRFWQMGFSAGNSDKINTRLRKAIDSSLAEKD